MFDGSGSVHLESDLCIHIQGYMGEINDFGLLCTNLCLQTSFSLQRSVIMTYLQYLHHDSISLMYVLNV